MQRCSVPRPEQNYFFLEEKGRERKIILSLSFSEEGKQEKGTLLILIHGINIKGSPASFLLSATHVLISQFCSSAIGDSLDDPDPRTDALHQRTGNALPRSETRSTTRAHERMPCINELGMLTRDRRLARRPGPNRMSHINGLGDARPTPFEMSSTENQRRSWASCPSAAFPKAQF